ncbi:MAG: carbohydrate ABC transporter permease [Acetanaerobacterium sp.]
MNQMAAAAQKRRKSKGKGKYKFSASQFFTYLILTFWGITTVYPFLWVIINSFRQKGEIRSDSFSIPWPWKSSFTLDNYITATERSNFLNAYTNSLLISVTVTVFVVLLAGLAAYGLVRYHFKGKKLLYGLIIASMMFPVFSTIIPVFRFEVAWGIASTGNRWASLLSVILPQIAGNLSFAIIVLMGFIRSVPIALEEAAFLDGCNVFEIYAKIIIPIAKSSFATVAIFSFLWSYNDLFTQMFLLRYPDEKTITLLLNEISSQAGVNYGLMAASVVLVVIPVLVVYIFLQKNIIKGLTVGAIRG